MCTVLYCTILYGTFLRLYAEELSKCLVTVAAPCTAFTASTQPCSWLCFPLELSMNLLEVSQCPERAPTRAFSYLKVPTRMQKDVNGTVKLREVR